MTQPVEELFNQGIQRYQDGEGPETLIPLFQEVCDRAQRNSAAWTCLAWLYLLADKPQSAYKAAQKAVKTNPEDAQARINLIIAMLAADQKGVRSHVELVQQLMLIPELRAEVEQSFADGLSRKPDWPVLIRVKSWVLGEAP